MQIYLETPLHLHLLPTTPVSQPDAQGTVLLTVLTLCRAVLLPGLNGLASVI